MDAGLDIVVLVAPVHDCRSAVRIEPEGRRIEPSSLRWIMNPYDASALETALRLRDTLPGTRVRVTSIAGPAAMRVLRECVAVGADEVVQVWDAALEGCEPYAAAVLLAAAIRSVRFNLVLCGSRCADLEHGQVGPVLAEVMKLPLVFGACGVRPGPTTDRVVVRKRIPGHVLTLSCALPAVVTLESGPPLRYPRYPDRRRAEKLAIPALDLHAMGFSGDVMGTLARTALERFTPPKPRRRSAVASASSGMSTAARLRRLVGGGGEPNERKIWECNDKRSVEVVVQHMLSERILIL